MHVRTVAKVVRSIGLTAAIYGGLAFAYCAGRVYTGQITWYAPFCDDMPYLGTFEQFIASMFIVSALGAFVYLLLGELMDEE